MFAPLTSVKLQDTALPFLSTWGRRISSFPPWNSTKDGSCLDSGDADTLYLRGGGAQRQSLDGSPSHLYRNISYFLETSP